MPFGWLLASMALLGSPGGPAARTGQEAPETSESPEALAARITASMRSEMEKAGITFTSFDCDAHPPLAPGDVFGCEGSSPGTGTVGVTVQIEPEGGFRLLTQYAAADSLPPVQLEPIETRCREWLDAYNREDWDAIRGLMHPQASAELVSGLVDRVKEQRGQYGHIARAEPRLYAVRGNQAELEFQAEGEAGQSVFRCGVVPGQADELFISAIAVAPRPGTREQAAILALILKERASARLGRVVSAVEAPLEKLRSAGDSVEGSLRFATEGGGEMPILIAQTGRRDDFDLEDYQLQVLDPDWLLRNRVASATAVSCPQRSLPDGGGVVCRVALENGREASVTAERRGSDLTLVPPSFGAGTSFDPSALQASLREELQGLLQDEGDRLASLECDLASPPDAGEVFDCRATAASGETRQLAVSVNGDGSLHLWLETRAAGSLPDAVRERLEAPCLAWLEALERRDWDAMVALLHPETRAEVGSDALESTLGELKPELPTEARTYAIRNGLDDEFEYRFDTRQGPYLFRCHSGRRDASGERTVETFLVESVPFSPAHTERLRGQLTGLLSQLAGATVTRLEVDLEELRRLGDGVEGLAWLAEDRSLRILVERIGRPDDYDTNDYTAEIIEAEFVILRGLAREGLEAKSVECPSRSAPGEGGTLTCRAVLADERVLNVVLRREQGSLNVRTRPAGS